MLDCLHIRNLALIEDMELDFGEGMNVLTGETGAGKSFILKALGFLLGERLKPDMVRPGADRAHVEAVFTLGGSELILRRELMASGRSRFYVNDELRTQETARDYREQLIAYTSQHGQQKLLQSAYQNELMEHSLAHTPLLEQRRILLQKLSAKKAELDQVLARQARLTEMRDLMEMQQQEIEKVGPEENEDERLEELRIRARTAEEQQKNYDAALALLYGSSDDAGILNGLDGLVRLLEHMCKADASLEPSTAAVTALVQELQHLSGTLRHPPVPDDMPEDMDTVEARLFELSQLKRRMRRTLPEILNLKAEIEEKISFLDSCALDISRLKRELAALENDLRTVLAAIRPLRHEACESFASALISQLKGLGFSEQVQVIPDYLPAEIWPGVQDERVRILWAPNPGQPPQPLDRIASGGELSRFLLALAGTVATAEEATYIFDEVDAGVGGITLNHLADRLDELAEHRQMLLITHWPQIAARAGRHFRIAKVVREGKTYTLCSQLTQAERKQELVRMAGGGVQGEAMANALEDKLSCHAAGTDRSAQR